MLSRGIERERWYEIALQLRKSLALVNSSHKVDLNT